MSTFVIKGFDRTHIAFAVLTASLFCAFAFQLWYHAVRTSPTVDEPTHILAGHRHWQCADFGINPEHPPLLKLVATAPLNFRTVIEPAWECGLRHTTQVETFAGGADFLIRNGIDETLIPSRLMAAILSLLLAAVVFVAALKMFGRWEALTALALLAFEPNLIAHGSLVTTDMVLTLTSLAAACALYYYSKDSTWTRFLVTGLVFGLLLSAKHSALIFLPVLFAVFIADGVFFRLTGTSVPKQIFRRTAAFGGFLFIGLIVLWSLYGFHRYSLPTADAPTVSIDEYIAGKGRPETLGSLAMKGVRNLNRTGILPEPYILGLADIIASSSRNTSIFNRNYASGQWFYFPLAFLVKSSVALLLLLPLGILLPFFASQKRRETMFILAPPVFFFAFSMTSKLNIGVRHILPVYGFFIIIAAAGAVWMSRRVPHFRYVLIVLLLFHAAVTVTTAPNYLAFANTFWGGTNNTYRIFPIDSNLDWSQNDKLVAEYLASENIGDCWYAGWGNVELMGATQPCRLMPGTFPRIGAPLAEAIPPVIEGTVLVSAANLPPRGGNEYVPMTLQKPVAEIGGAIFVYRGRFEIKLASAVSHAQRSDQLLGLDRLDEAIADGRAAVELADYDPRPHLALGLALLRAGDKSNAALEFGAVLQTSRANMSLFENLDARARLELQRMALESKPSP